MLRLALSLVLLASCRPKRDLSQYVEEDPRSRLSPRLALGNPLTEGQLKSGFHQLEEGRWSWAASHFSVELKPPFASQQRGATLTLKGNLPEMLIARTGAIVVSAQINKTTLPPMTFRQAGVLMYQADVEAASLLGGPVIVTFTVDKFLPPNTIPGDGRELALIVSSIALETKK